MTSIEKAIEKAAAKRREDAVESQNAVEAASESHQRNTEAAAPAAEHGANGEGLASNHVATLDLKRVRAHGMMTPDAGDSPMAEELRHIKRPLLNNAFGPGAALVDDGNLILVTSALPGEGKTFISMSLAVSVAMELDKTVLLVDADILKESATKFFHEEMELGLLDVIVNPDVRLEDVIVRTNVPKLSFLPSGRPRGKATELLTSASMQQITQELGSRYNDRIIVFDSPPLLMSSEACVLASLMGQIVLVIEAEKTTQKRVAEALALLDQDKPVAMLLNKSRTSERPGYYYGYYGYK